MTAAPHRLPPSDAPSHTQWSVYVRKVVQPSLVYLILAVGMILVLMPFIWMLSSAFKPTEQVVLPYLFGSALYIFLLRQYFMSLPTELDDAARIDGCNTFQIYALILLPLATPVLATIAVLEFLAAWNSFLEPLIYLSTKNNFTLALGLTLFQQGFGGNIQWGPLMAATTLSALPPLIVCFAAQKYLIGGIAGSGIKG